MTGDRNREKAAKKIVEMYNLARAQTIFNGLTAQTDRPQIIKDS